MDNSSDGYHISFFNPSNPHAKANRNMVVWFVLIWFFAIFGFQVLLKILEKPTPEPAYIAFQNVWGNVETGTPNTEELQILGQSTLSVLGKVAVTPDDRALLDNAFSWSIYQLTDESSKENLIAKVQAFEKLKAEIDDISNPEYNQSKLSITTELRDLLNLPADDVRTKILPLELDSRHMAAMTGNTKQNLAGIMEKYLVHNQSILTDTRFLGFPLHYFYTATFLLILFVGLCWMYCVKTDILNAKFNIDD